jgi:hypothetical protein
MSPLMGLEIVPWKFNSKTDGTIQKCILHYYLHTIM